MTTTITAANQTPIETKSSIETKLGYSLPIGGTTNQALLKTSATDYAVAWTSLTKSMVGLSAVNNTSDANKPVSTAQAAAIAAAVAAQPEFFSIAIGDETTAIGSILKG